MQEELDNFVYWDCVKCCDPSFGFTPRLGAWERISNETMSQELTHILTMWGSANEMSTKHFQLGFISRVQVHIVSFFWDESANGKPCPN
jgi:hypothetical protein